MIPSVSLATLLGGIFGLVLLVGAVMTLVLFYHWIRYNLGLFSTLLVMVVYSVGAGALVLAALGVLAQV